VLPCSRDFVFRYRSAAHWLEVFRTVLWPDGKVVWRPVCGISNLGAHYHQQYLAKNSGGREFEKSVHDFNAALKGAPKLASSLYGLVLTSCDLAKKDSGEADIAAATTLSGNVSDNMRRYDIHP
jgi:hypothetical protein